MIYPDRSIGPLEKKAKKTTGPLFEAGEIDTSILQTIPYEYPRRKITVELACDEFTCVCPFSGLPDFARLTVTYTPRKRLIELKSLKYYLYAFRSVKIYNEHAVNKILGDLKKALAPRQIEIRGEFTSRGGITNRVTARYKNNSQARNPK